MRPSNEVNWVGLFFWLLAWCVGAFLFVALLLLSFPPMAHADDSFRVRVQMELTQKQREKERSRDATGQRTPAYLMLSDRDEAAKKAYVESRPLLLWVGLTAGELPDLRTSLPDAVHCLVAENYGDRRPRVILVNPADYATGFTWRLAEIDRTTPEAITRQYYEYKRKVRSESTCPTGVCGVR